MVILTHAFFADSRLGLSACMIILTGFRNLETEAASLNDELTNMYLHDSMTEYLMTYFFPILPCSSLNEIEMSASLHFNSLA